jgi:plasmid stability protein
MRTTFNLDDDVAAQLAAEARRRGTSQSRAANELIRAGLRAAREPVAPSAYEPPTFDTGRVLLDVTDVAAALEILDGER